jgi:hypothetical protein
MISDILPAIMTPLVCLVGAASAMTAFFYYVEREG